jgi:hypothetical protein
MQSPVFYQPTAIRPLGRIQPNPSLRKVTFVTKKATHSHLKISKQKAHNPIDFIDNNPKTQVGR